MTPVSEIEIGCILNTLNSTSSRRDSMDDFVTPESIRGSCTMENPLLNIPSVNSELITRYLDDNNQFLTNISSNIFELGGEAVNLHTELSVDMELITNACRLEMVTSNPMDIVDNAKIKLQRLEEIVEESRGKQLWSMVREEKWATMLDTINQVKGNLKPLEVTSRERNYTMDRNEWLKSLRSNLKTIK